MRDRVRVMATDLASRRVAEHRATRCARARSTSRAARRSSSTATGTLAHGERPRAADARPRRQGHRPADFQDLDVSYRPVELRARARADRRGPPADRRSRGCSWRSPSGQRARPRRPDDARRLRRRAARDGGDLPRRRPTSCSCETELDGVAGASSSQAHEELQSTVEELETTNEELQSTNEELETTNEELQSTNEELETMNEELQSTNEELETMNDELRQRTFELNDVNAFLETILDDDRARGRRARPAARTCSCGTARRASCGDSARRRSRASTCSGSTSGCPSSSSADAARRPEGGERRVSRSTLDAVNRRGKAIRCKVSCMTLSPLNDGVVTGLIVMMEPRPA